MFIRIIANEFEKQINRFLINGKLNLIMLQFGSHGTINIYKIPFE